VADMKVGMETMLESVEAVIDHNLSLPEDAPFSEHINVLVESMPGQGKTTSITNLLATKGLACPPPVVLAQYDPQDLAGWPLPVKDGECMRRIRPDWMPTIETHGLKGAILFDEARQQETMGSNMLAQIVQERRIGEHKIPHGWTLIMCANRDEDRAGTNPMPSQLTGRITFIELEVSIEDSMSFANKAGWHDAVKAYLRFAPQELNTFDPDAAQYASPRGWERVSTIMNLSVGKSARTALISGTIGGPATAKFMGFLDLQEKCPDINALIDNPDGAEVIMDAPIQYAVCAALSTRMNKVNAANVLKYLGRLDKEAGRGEMAAFVVRDAMSRDKVLAQYAPVREWLINTGAKLIL